MFTNDYILEHYIKNYSLENLFRMYVLIKKYIQKFCLIKHDLKCFKFILKFGGYIGAFPLNEKLYIQNIILILSIILTIAAVACYFLLVTEIKKDDVIALHLFINTLFKVIVIVFYQCVCMFATVQDKENWKSILQILENIDMHLKSKMNLIRYIFVLPIFFLLTFISEIYFIALGKRNISSPLYLMQLAYFYYYLQFKLLLTIVLIWEFSNILQAKFKRLSTLMAHVTKRTRIQDHEYTKMMDEIKMNIHLLHEVCFKFNDVSGKRILAILAKTIQNVLSNIYFPLLINFTSSSDIIRMVNKEYIIFLTMASMRIWVSKYFSESKG